MSTTPTQILPLPTAQYRRNRRWITEHYAKLVSQYATGWIAVHDGNVLASDPNLGAVAEKAEKIAPPEHIAYQFVDDGTMIYYGPLKG